MPTKYKKKIIKKKKPIVKKKHRKIHPKAKAAISATLKKHNIKVGSGFWQDLGSAFTTIAPFIPLLL